ncbi:MAG TPA: 5'-nucleotidase C-terminal domain-containing protein, partial [Afifellaceae bacterium]|nr:5'-nucleotidase C-terminal domain-containing protein [Afifellaceae bacterium]
YRTTMSGKVLKDVLEDVADNLFNPDPYYQQGGDMVRVGGMGYRIDPSAAMGARVTEMTLLSTGEAIDPVRDYVVAGWASVNEGTEGPAIWDVVSTHIENRKVIELQPNRAVRITGF